MSNFNGIDYVVFGLLFISTGIGIFRGFIKEIISLIAWIAAFVIATLYSVQFAGLFIASADHTPGNNLADSIPTVFIIISYLVLFFGVLICGSIVKYIVNYIVESGGISTINRLLGALLGFGRGCVVVLLLMFFLGFTSLATAMLWKESKMVTLCQPVVAWMNKVAQPYLAVIQDKIKKAAKGVREEEDISDVIKAKPINASPVKDIVTPTVVAPSYNGTHRHSGK